MAIQPLDLRQVAVTHWRDFEWVYTIQVGLLGAPLHQETLFAAGMQHGRDAGYILFGEEVSY